MKGNPPPHRIDWTHTRRDHDLRTDCGEFIPGPRPAAPGEIPTCPTCAGHMAAAFWVEWLAGCRNLSTRLR